MPNFHITFEERRVVTYGVGLAKDEQEALDMIEQGRCSLVERGDVLESPHLRTVDFEWRPM